MLPELGHFALILALLLSALQASFGIAGPHLKRDRWIAVVTPAVAGQFVLVATAFGCLMASFIANDFSVRYVALNSNTALPIFYRAAAVWGSHEGSLVLWILLLAAWTVAVAFTARRMNPHFTARVLGVLGVVSFGFLLFTLATSNPFIRLEQIPADGNDLNPLLQDPGLVIHPPILYMGYVGFAVPFAFAGAAMIEGKLDQHWARWTRPFTTMAWAFLSVGIALGSWWAYYELGWGGYWFWDPVENASFMPWIAGTALIHSLAVTEKRGLFKSWTLLLAVLAFSLSLLGTFLVRSGITVSVHSFASDPSRGIFILAFLIVMIGGALTLYAWRAPLLKSNAGFEFDARESFLLFNNVLLTIALATVFGGTMAPLIAEAFGFTVSVGTPYFNGMFPLSMLPLLALVPIGIHANWKRGRVPDKRRELLVTLAIAVVVALALSFGVFAGPRVLTPVGFTLGVWIFLSSLIDPIDRLRRRMTLSRGVLGMTLAHVGLAILVIGLTSVESFTKERDIGMAPGETVELGNYQVHFEKIEPADGPNYDATRATMHVSRNGMPMFTLLPEKRVYWMQRTPQTESGIGSFRGGNVLVALGDDLGAGRWSVRIQVRPLVNWVWLSAFIMAFGGLLAATDKRYRARALASESMAVQDGTTVKGSAG